MRARCFLAAGFLELALHAGNHADCPQVEELALHTPLPLRDGSRIQLRVTVNAADNAARRKVSIHSRLIAAENSVTSGGWTCHANGLVNQVEHGERVGVDTWPPLAAAAVIDGFYDQLLQVGYSYGDAFQGVRGVWRRDADLFVEVVLPNGVRSEAGRFTLHPALLDAALLPLLLDGVASGQARMPFSVNWIQVHGSGVSALRVRLAGQGKELSVFAADSTGQPVLSIGAMVTRPISGGQLAAGRRSTTESSSVS
jgi:acyl transferase domain-containing protein